MALQSMTGFSRSRGEFSGISWTWEIRSVNGKGLDVRLRIPQGYEALEIPVRRQLSGMFSRGNLQVSLQVLQAVDALLPKVNFTVVDSLLESARDIQQKLGGELPSVSDLMGMRGVIEFSEASVTSEEEEARNLSMLESLEVAANALREMREEEGAAVTTVLEEQVGRITGLRDKIDANEARLPESVSKRLGKQVIRLLEAQSDLDGDRLYQEAVILAAKADLQEELDRLAVHVDSVRKILSGNGPAGRKLDFLAQEFNRECNTICSKSNSAEVTSLGLDMKLLIDQFREQVQNLE